MIIASQAKTQYLYNPDARNLQVAVRDHQI